jgi:DNA repair exonuclease SbcCD ATPase subunit
MTDIIIESIKITNFVSIKEASLELGGDIFFVTGENRDEMSAASNGAGKSLFLQAIGWGLFEDTPRKGMLKDDVIGPFNSYCEVSLTLSKGGQSVTICRTRKHPEKGSGASVYIDDSEDLSRHSKAETDKFIEEILGFNSKIFYYCIYADSDKEPLVSLTSAKLNAVVAEILNTQRFDDYLSYVRKVKKAATAAYESEASSRRHLLEAAKLCSRDIEENEQRLKQFESDKKDKISKLKESLKKSEQEKAEFLALLEGREAVKVKLEGLTGEIAEAEELNVKVNSAQKSVTHLQKRLEVATTKFNKAKLEVDKSEEAYDNIFNNVTGSCSYCGNALQNSDTLSSHSKMFAARRDEAKASLIEAEVDLNLRRQELAEAEQTLEERRKELDSKVESTKTYQKLQRKAEAYSQVEASLRYCEKEISRLKGEIESVKKTTPVLIMQDLKKLNERKISLDQELSQATENLRNAELGVEACGLLEHHIASTKAGLFNTFVIELQERINANFADMTEGEYDCSFEQRDEELMMVFTNSSKNGVYLPYSVFSRGERARISKAAAMALNDMVGAGLLIDDEGIEGVDDGGGAALLDFIIEKSENRSLFFVSHKDFVKDYFKGHQNIHIVKENGVTSVELRSSGDTQ